MPNPTPRARGIAAGRAMTFAPTGVGNWSRSNALAADTFGPDGPIACVHGVLLTADCVPCVDDR